MKIAASQLRRIIKEEVSAAMGHDHAEFLHGHESGHPMDDEGYMVKSRMATLAKMAGEICEVLDTEDQLPGWVQDLVATSHNDLQHVHDYLVGDLEMRKHQMSPKLPAMAVESRRRRAGRLSEGHARITEEEFAAWKKGDWGFVSEVGHSRTKPRKKLSPVPVDPSKGRPCTHCGGRGRR